jgi:hypothetical protein
MFNSSTVCSMVYWVEMAGVRLLGIFCNAAVIDRAVALYLDRHPDANGTVWIVPWEGPTL